MGCFDVYCFICGNNTYGMIDDAIYYGEEVLRIIDANPKTKRINYKSTMNNVAKLINGTKWMYNCSMLLINDEVLHGLHEMSGNVLFKNKQFSAEHIIPDHTVVNFELFPCGVFIHTDCLNYVNHNYNIDLRFSHLPPMTKQPWKKLFDINYGHIEKYYSQFFDFLKVAIDNKVYLCSSPLKGDKNLSQINRNISNLKLKLNPKLNAIRKGPMTSATFYKNKTIKIGNNKMFWTIKNGKWKQINDKPITLNIKINVNKISSGEKKYMKKIPFIGESNDIPVFIINSSRLPTNRHTYKLEMLVLDGYKDIFMSKLPSI